jgi:hypothetical protein
VNEIDWPIIPSPSHLTAGEAASQGGPKRTRNKSSGIVSIKHASGVDTRCAFSAIRP